MNFLNVGTEKGTSALTDRLALSSEDETEVDLPAVAIPVGLEHSLGE